MKIERYPAYKDSELEWLGDVPKHWEIRRLKDISKLIIDGTHFTPDYTDYGVHFLSVNDITRKPFDINQSKFISRDAHKELIKRCHPKKGDILLSKNGTIGVPFLIDFDDEVSIYVSLCLIKVLSQINGRYSYYSFLASFMFEQYNLHSKMTSVTNLHLDKLRNFFQLSPPLTEQKAIVHYLDTKTAQYERKIDLLIQKATLYTKIKQSLINETVTRGLDKSVPLKDSGIEWLGEVPEHWTISRIKDKGSVRGRVGWKALKADEYVDKGYIFLSTPNIKGQNIDFDNVNYITYERYIESPEIMLQEGDILLAKDGSTLGIANIISLLPGQATVNSSIAVIRFNKSIFKKYLLYQIKSEFIQDKISIKKSGMGVPHLFQRDINNFFIVLPPLSEQKAIANYLDAKTAQIDQIIQTINTQIEKLKELRKTLINDVVTGKIKV